MDVTKDTITLHLLLFEDSPIQGTKNQDILVSAEQIFNHFDHSITSELDTKSFNKID